MVTPHLASFSINSEASRPQQAQLPEQPTEQHLQQLLQQLLDQRLQQHLDQPLQQHLQPPLQEDRRKDSISRASRNALGRPWHPPLQGGFDLQDFKEELGRARGLCFTHLDVGRRELPRCAGGQSWQIPRRDVASTGQDAGWPQSSVLAGSLPSCAAVVLRAANIAQEVPAAARPRPTCPVSSFIASSSS